MAEQSASAWQKEDYERGKSVNAIAVFVFVALIISVAILVYFGVINFMTATVLVVVSTFIAASIRIANQWEILSVLKDRGCSLLYPSSNGSIDTLTNASV